ncbi:MAG: hypothetical protein WC595_05100 [Candidatus Nanoarchaeia archaeon]
MEYSAIPREAYEKVRARRWEAYSFHSIYPSRKAPPEVKGGLGLEVDYTLLPAGADPQRLERTIAKGGRLVFPSIELPKMFVGGERTPFSGFTFEEDAVAIHTQPERRISYQAFLSGLESLTEGQPF